MKIRRHFSISTRLEIGNHANFSDWINFLESGSETLEVGTSSSPATGRRLPAAGLLNIGPDGAPVIETVTAYEVRKQKEEELRQNDRVWGSKLRELEKRVSKNSLIFCITFVLSCWFDSRVTDILNFFIAFQFRRSLCFQYAASAFASQEEFNTKLEKLQSLVPQRRPNPCNNLSAKVAECYSSNPTQPLRCSEEVKQFAQCVERVRA